METKVTKETTKKEIPYEHTMKMVMKRIIWDIIINKQSLLVLYAIPHKRHQMPMVDPTYNLYLSLKLSLALTTTARKSFYCNFPPILQLPFVHASKTSLTQDIIRQKAISYFMQLLISEVF
jgi:hypothetical protein